MIQIPDAPWITAAETYGMEYVSEWYGFTEEEDDEEE